MYLEVHRMKKEVKHIVILFLAATIFFVGAGVTIVDLCCSRCADSFMSMSESADDCMQHSDMMRMSDDCCAQKAHPKSTACDTHHSDKSDCCKKERLSIDLNNTIYKHSLSDAMVWSLVALSNNSSLFLSSCDKYIQPDVVEQITIPPRDYLSLIRILII